MLQLHSPNQPLNVRILPNCMVSVTWQMFKKCILNKWMNGSSNFESARELQIPTFINLPAFVGWTMDGGIRLLEVMMSLLCCWQQGHTDLSSWFSCSFCTSLSNPHAWWLSPPSHSTAQSSSFPTAIPVNFNFLSWLSRVPTTYSLRTWLPTILFPLTLSFSCCSAHTLPIHNHSTTIPVCGLCHPVLQAADTLCSFRSFY